MKASFSFLNVHKIAVILSRIGTVTEGGCEYRAEATGFFKRMAAILWFLVDTV